MSDILLGPYPYSFSTLEADARAALGHGASALWDQSAEALMALAANGDTPGLYLIVRPPGGAGVDGQARLVGLWLSLGPEYLRDGPPGPPDPAPPFLEPLIEALIEEVWWNSLPVASPSRYAWRLPIVVEWLPALAIRAALAPPGEPQPIERAPPPQPSTAARSDRPPEASSVWFDVGGELEEPTHPPFAPPPPPEAAAAPSSGERAGTGLPAARSVLCLFEAHLELSARLHRARARLIATESFTTGAWSDWLSATDDGRRDTTHRLGRALELPGDRVGFPASGWLTRTLTVWPGLPSELGAIHLPERIIQSQLRGKLNQAASLLLTALSSVLGLSIALRVLADPTPLPAPRAPDLPPQPALTPCSADHERFVEELRCQIDAMANEAGGLRADPTCGDRLAARDETSRSSGVGPTTDLQATLCGLVDRELDGRGARLRAGDPAATWGELVAAQACFNALSHPREYALPAHGTQLMVADTERFLHDPGLRIEPLVALTAELRDACDTMRARGESVVEGAIFATHVGTSGVAAADPEQSSPSVPPANNPQQAREEQGRTAEAARLRQGLVRGVVERRADEDASCFLAGLSNGTSANRAATLCGEPDSTPPAAGARTTIWDRLAGHEPAERSALNRYADARFPAPGGGAGSPLWSCHLALSNRATSLSPPRGLLPWDRAAIVPRAYNIGGAGVRRQLDLDATLMALDQGLSLGPCWDTVRETLRDYEPVHPLVAELGEAEWPSAEQQLCGQVCAAWHRLRPRKDEWYTPDADLDACVSTAGPPNDAAPFRGTGTLDQLALPWNTPEPSAWLAPTRTEVCAFHLLAQGYLGQGEEGFIGEGISPREWAGVTVEGGTIAGGSNGRAVQSVVDLYGQGTASASRSRCAAVAAQCLTGLLLEVTPDPTRAPYQWLAAWSARVDSVAGRGATGPSFGRRSTPQSQRELPWCAPLTTFLKQTPREELRPQGESTCQLGVDLVRLNLGASIRAMAGDPVVTPAGELATRREGP